MNKAEFEEFKEFKQWKAQQDTAEKIDEAVEKEKINVNEVEPFQIPRELIYIMILGIAVYIVSMWPILILGVVVGAFAMLRFGCPITQTKTKQWRL